MQKPRTRVDIVSEVLFGRTINDPYRWLENGQSSEVKEWTELQNKYTDSELRGSTFDIFSKELINNYHTSAFSCPKAVNGRYFWTERKPDQDQAVLYYKDGHDGKPVVIFDPNGKRDGNTITINSWKESKAGRYVAYISATGGTELGSIYIFDIRTNKLLEDKIDNCRYTNIIWNSDDSGFYYCRHPEKGSVPDNELTLHSKVFFHKLGEHYLNDKMIFGEGRPKDDMISLGYSSDKKLLVVNVSQKWTEQDVYIYSENEQKIRPLIIGFKSKFSVIMIKDKVLIYTNFKANNFRVLWNTYENLYSPIDSWPEFISENKDILLDISVTKTKIITEYLVDVCSKVIEYDYESNIVGEILLPENSSLSGLSHRRDQEEFFYSVTSYTFPNIIYRYDPEFKKYTEYKRIENPISPDEYNVKKDFYVSKDNTKIPIFIISKKDISMNGANPTILYGYGGFGNTKTPAFMRGWVPWLERGYIFAVANIRGGGEYGDHWHKDGIKFKKQNSFDDFISAGEFLIDRKYTSPQHLGILGGSNGGLLVSAVGVQRPDLFKAICSMVPLTDMVRFHKFGMAIRWIHEYGNPEDPEELNSILKWSPYHNVKTDTKYPRFLFTTGINDTRVDPLHARKMCALIQATNNNSLLLTEMDSGHGSGKPISKIVETQALVLTFFEMELSGT